MPKDKLTEEIENIIEAKNLEQLKKRIKIKNGKELFETLFTYLKRIIRNSNNNTILYIHRLLDFLEAIVNEEELELLEYCEEISKLKQIIIEIRRKNEKKAKLYEQKNLEYEKIEARITELETNLIQSMEGTNIEANDNFIKYIIFDLKDSNISEDLIEKKPHFINSFCINSENIYMLLVDKILESLEKYKTTNESYDLFYYDKVLEKILTNPKILKDKEQIKECIEKLKGINKIDFTYWYKHLIELLEDPNYIDDIESLNKMYEIEYDFSEEIKQEGHKQRAKYLRKRSIKESDDFIITIDGDETKDRDDAMCVKKVEDGLYKLKIIIADPNTYFKNARLSLEEAIKRVENFYLEDRIISIFPQEIVESYLSLDEGQIRLAREYEYLITSSGIIEDFKIRKKKVKVNKNYTYNDFDSLLEICYSEKEEQTIEELLELKNIIEKGLLDGIITSDYKTKSESIIETFMIFTNNKLAEYAASKGIPMVYRHHILNKTLDGKKISTQGLSSNGKREYNEAIKEAEKVQISALYSLDKTKHEGLALPYYCHSTSPIRRSADILVNSCLDKFYHGRPTDKEAEEFLEVLKEQVKYINDRSLKNIRYYEKYERAITRKRK